MSWWWLVSLGVAACATALLGRAVGRLRREAAALVATAAGLHPVGPAAPAAQRPLRTELPPDRPS